MIRFARPADHPAIAAVVEAAFGQVDEARLVEALRENGDALFEMVAEEDGRIAGHILFSRLWADRYELFAALAPLSVAPDRRGAGLGGALIRSGLESVKEFGAHGVLVLGDPAYYGRHGFTAAAAAQVSAPYAGQPGFMARALEDGAFDGPLTVGYPDPFSA